MGKLVRLVRVDKTANQEKMELDAHRLPNVDLESVRNYVNRLPPGQLEDVAKVAWRAAKKSSFDVARNLYIIAFIMSRLADEQLLVVG